MRPMNASNATPGTFMSIGEVSRRSGFTIKALRFYERCGYREAAARAIVKDDWQNDGRHWVLLTKAL